MHEHHGDEDGRFDHRRRGRAAAASGSSRATPRTSTTSSARSSLADADTFVDACRAAREAQREWAAVPAPVRGNAIQQIGRIVEDNKEALSRLVTREIGKPYPESLGEVQEIIDTCDFFLGEGRRLYGQTVPSEMPDKQLFTFRNAGRSRRDHHGRQLPGGRPLVVPRAGDPVRQRRRLEAGRVRARARRRARAAVHRRRPARRRPQPGRSATARPPSRASSARSDERLVDKVGFTGSSAVGSRIGELCGRHVQSPCLELGGKNPLVVMPDADLDLAVEGALFSGFGTAGQRCTSLGTVIVHESIHDEFMRALHAAASRTAAIGDPTQDVLYGPMIHERFAERFEDWLGLIRDHHSVSGSTRHAAGSRADNPRDGFVGDPDAGIYCHPTIVDGVRADDEIYATETFGPIVGVAKFSRLRRGDRAGQRPRLRAVVGDLHERPEVGLPLPRARERRDGVGQQLDERRRGAPALRRQRQVRQRLRASPASGCSTSSPAGSR